MDESTAALNEREAIVRWLRYQGKETGNIVLFGYAAAIEDGEHLEFVEDEED